MIIEVNKTNLGYARLLLIFVLTFIYKTNINYWFMFFK